MRSLNFKDISAWDITLAVVILMAIALILFFNNRTSNILNHQGTVLAGQAVNVEKLEARINELENENLKLKQTLALYNEKNFKKLLITISEHDRKIDLLNETIKKLY